MTFATRWRLSALALVVLVLALPSAALGGPVAQQPRTITVLVGAGQDTTQAFNFFPQTVRVRQGDSITWRINGDELHTAGFVAGTSWDPATGYPRLS